MSPRRKRSLRWRGYNYASAGSYFVTVCIQGRVCRLGGVVDGEVELSAVGEMVQEVWSRIPEAFPGVTLGRFVIMPNHVHGVIRFRDLPDTKRPTLGQVLSWWKSETTRAYANRVRTGEWPRFKRRLWQVGFHDRVIRDVEEGSKIDVYILRNPRNWQEDDLHPDVTP